MRVIKNRRNHIGHNFLFTVFTFLLLLISYSSYSATNVTISTVGWASTNTAIFNVPTGHVAKVVYAHLGGNSWMNVQAGEASKRYVAGQEITNAHLPTIVGPGSVLLFSPTTGDSSAFCTIEVRDPLTVADIPSTTVVIPADSNGPVSIILESSVDMINWTPALPGTYGTTHQKRFFRVRAQR